MRLECEYCGETFILKAKQLKHMIRKDFETDSDVSRDVIECPMCGGMNNVGDNVIWAAKMEKAKKNITMLTL